MGFSKLNIRVNYSLFVELAVTLLMPTVLHQPRAAKLATSGRVNTAALLPLWLTHTRLYKASLAFLLRLLQSAAVQSPDSCKCKAAVEGMDEVRQTDHLGLVEIGVKLTQRCMDWRSETLAQVLDRSPFELALQMLHLSMRPMYHANMLLDMAWLSVDLHEAVAGTALLSTPSRDTFKAITKRKDSIRGLSH